MKNKMLQPPSSQLLRKTMSLNTCCYSSSSSTASPTATESSTASTSTLLIESTEINYCKKSLLITTPVEKEAIKRNEIETQTVNIEYKDAFVQTEIIPLNNNEEEEEVNEEEPTVKIELFEDVDIYNNMDLDNPDNLPFKEINQDYYPSNDDVILVSPLPSIRSPTPPPRIIKKKKKKKKFKILFKLSRKYVKQAIKAQSKKNDKNTTIKSNLFQLMYQ